MSTASVLVNSEPLDAILAALGDYGVARDGRQWKARCPAHADRTPSLGIDVASDGRVLLHCRAGCSTASIVRALGKTMADLFPARAGGIDTPMHPKAYRMGGAGHRNGTRPAAVPRESSPRGPLVATYDYTDADGALLYQACRFEPGRDGKPKDFLQRRPDPDRPGEWIWKLDDTPRVLYRLPELLEDVALGRRICVVEGEKDVDTLRALGVPATTNVGGAGKWRESDAECLAGADVLVLPDNDDAGRQHAEQVVRSLEASGARVQVLALTGLPEKGDVTDWLAAGHTVEELDALAGQPMPSAPNTSDLPDAVCLQDVPDDDPVRWLVPGMIPAAEPALIAGPEGEMKSTIALYLACAVAGGGAFLGRAVEAPGPVLIVSGEDSQGVVKNRCRAIAAGQGWSADRVLGQIYFVDADGADLARPKWQQHLLGLVERIRPAVVVLDPLANLSGGDENASRPDVRWLWRALTKPSGASAVLVHHAGKRGDASKSKRDRIRGHTDIVAASRATFFVEREPAGIVVDNIKQSRADKVRPFILEPFIQKDPGNPGAWTLARFDIANLREATRSAVESWLLEFIVTYPGSMTKDVRSAAVRAKFEIPAVSQALRNLETAGLITSDSGPGNAKFWRLTTEESVSALDEGQTANSGSALSALSLPGQTASDPLEPACPPYKGGQAPEAEANDEGRHASDARDGEAATDASAPTEALA